MKIEDVWQDWHVEKKIGRGSYGTVYKCFKEETGMSLSDYRRRR